MIFACKIINTNSNLIIIKKEKRLNGNNMKKKMVIIFIWLLIWQGLSMLVSNDILLAGPYETIKALISLCGDRLFYFAIINTQIRIIAGILSAFIFAVSFAALSYKIRLFREFMAPLVSVLKSIPVASFVIILLIWAGNKNVSLFICLMVGFPLIYIPLLGALLNLNKGLKELADLYKMSLLKKIRFMIWPQIKETVISSLKLAIGMGFKSGIAAELIGQPLNTIGNGLYRAKVSLETDRLFAWTLVIVLISYLLEKFVIYILRKLS